MGKVKTAKAKAEQKTLGQRMQRRRLLAEVREEAAEFAQGIRSNMDPAEAVQEVLDHIMAAYRYATEKMFTLTEDEYWVETLGGKRQNEWITEQERLALQVVHIAGKASSMGLAERQVRLQEAQAAIFAQLVEAALQAAGIDSDKRRAVHERIAAGMEDIDGTARDAEPVKVLAA